MPVHKETGKIEGAKYVQAADRDSKKEIYTKTVMARPKFRRNIQTVVPLCFALLLATVVIAVVYTTHTIVKPILLTERMFTISETGKSVISEIHSMLDQAEIAASMIGYATEGLLPDYAAIKETVPKIFDTESLHSISAGGGIWPEPFKFDPERERFSFFWGRDSDGRLRFYDDYNLSGYHRREWYVPVKYLKGSRVFWSRSYIDPFSHEPMVTCSKRMEWDGQFMGVATVDLRLSSLNRLFKDSAKEIQGYIYALDRNNRFITFPREDYIVVENAGRGSSGVDRYLTSRELAKNHAEFAPISNMLEKINESIVAAAERDPDTNRLASRILSEAEGMERTEALLVAAYLNQPAGGRTFRADMIESFSVEDDVLYHEPVMVSIFLMPETNWKVVITVPKRVAVAPVSRITNGIVASLAALIVLVFTGAGLFLYSHFLRPLRNLTDQLKKIERDSADLSLELDIPANNELGELAYYFNLRTRELRNSEERYRTIFDRASEGISLSSINGDFIAVNPRFAQIFGYESPEEVIRRVKTYDLYVDPSDRKEILAALQSGNETVHREVWFKKKDGTHILVSLNLGPVTDRNGRVKYLIALTQDVTRTKELEAELRHAQKMEAIGNLAGGIAHDFNNILAAITGYTELAQLEAKEDSRIGHYLSQIELASRRAKELVRRILTFSRYTDTGKESQDLSKVIKEVLKLLRSTLPANIAIETDMDRTGPVLANPSDLTQIVMNLCTNAYHAMRDKGGTLSIRLAERELSLDRAEELGVEPGRYAVMEVEDTGCGIGKDILDKIFEPYFTTKGKEEGTGLGLAVVHGIVKGLRGAIRVDSIPGSGTCFRVFLPVVQETGEVEQAVDSVQVDRSSAIGRGRKVMFVDDEEMICAIFQALLPEAGFQVAVFSNGQEALASLEKAPHEWDLLITDMTMPGMSGSDLIKEARKLNPGLPVILCSGYSDLLTDAFMEELEIDAFLSKPVDRTTLFREIARILRRRPASDEA